MARQRGGVGLDFIYIFINFHFLLTAQTIFLFYGQLGKCFQVKILKSCWNCLKKKDAAFRTRIAALQPGPDCYTQIL